jgi:hypothetical protein
MLNPNSIRYPADLPITARREEILGAIRGNQVLILAGVTGSEASQADRFLFWLTVKASPLCPRGEVCALHLVPLPVAHFMVSHLLRFKTGKERQIYFIS